MTTKEKLDRIHTLQREEAKLARKIVDQARMVVPILLDADRTHSAQPLQELLFQFDALVQEMDEIVKSDPKGVMFALLESLIGSDK
jgi:hypothetical protein